MSAFCKYPFDLEFVIFDKNNLVAYHHTQIRRKLLRDGELKNILEDSLTKYEHNYKLLDRFEPALSTMDEKKQLRLYADTIHSWDPIDMYAHSLYFHQHHSANAEYFTLEELKEIATHIQKSLEEFLGYQIDDPIIYIDTSMM